MTDPFDIALDQIDSLMGAMSVPAEVRAAVRLLISGHTPRDQIRARAAALPEVSTLGQIARRFHKSSLSRNALITPGIVQDGPWNMLLDLFAAGEEGRSISVTSLCLASGLPATTALRAIQWLRDHGLVERAADRDDRRRTWVTLTPQARERMATMIADFTVPTPPIFVRRS